MKVIFFTNTFKVILRMIDKLTTNI